MGSPKQLLRIDGITLVRRAAETALASRCQGVHVVVGAAAEAIRREVSDLSLEVIESTGYGQYRVSNCFGLQTSKWHAVPKKIVWVTYTSCVIRMVAGHSKSAGQD